MTRKTELVRQVLSVCLITLFSSCDPSTAHHSFQHITDNAWNRRDTVCFTLDSLPANAAYTFLIELRTNPSYPYQSLWLAVCREMNNPALLICDTIECVLNGRQENRTAPGIHSHTRSFSLTPLQLYQGQTGSIRVVHLMRRETLPGICDVGLCVRR